MFYTAKRPSWRPNPDPDTILHAGKNHRTRRRICPGGDESRCLVDVSLVRHEEIQATWAWAGPSRQPW
jgi:hypothetical protein